MIEAWRYDTGLYDIAVEGKSGKSELKKYILPKFDTVHAYNYREGYRYHEVLNGDFKLVYLTEDQIENAWMTSYPEDIDDSTPIVEAARGDMLQLGLGMGLIPYLLRHKLNSGVVSNLDIVELNQDVINLVWKYTKKPNISLIIGDAWDYIKTTDKKYDTIFCDIFCKRQDAVVGGKIMAEIAKRCLNPNGVIRWWLQEISENMKHGREPYRYNSERPCRICGTTPHANAYDGFCLECADDYEAWIKYYTEKGLINLYYKE